MADIKDTLKQNVEGLLSEDALNEIESAFNAAVEERSALHVEAALVKQDEDHAGKVQSLLMAIDDDHTKKLDRIVHAVNENHTQKLKQVITKYQGTLNEEAGDFKSTIVGSISNYLDLYMDKTFPAEVVQEAVNNKRAQGVLGEVRKLLSVDMALAKDSIRDAVVDGRNQINEATEQLTQVKAENETLKVQLDSAQATEVLDRLSADLPDYKKKYVQKVLCDKSAQFITENFGYTLELFDKESTKKNEVLREEAQRTVKGGNVDPVVAREQVIEEAATDVDADPAFNNYMNELGKY
jgi:hypothetical protein